MVTAEWVQPHRARAREPKELSTIDGANYIDLYGTPQYVPQGPRQTDRLLPQAPLRRTTKQQDGDVDEGTDRRIDRQHRSTRHSRNDQARAPSPRSCPRPSRLSKETWPTPPPSPTLSTESTPWCSPPRTLRAGPATADRRCFPRRGLPPARPGPADRTPLRRRHQHRGVAGQHPPGHPHRRVHDPPEPAME